jgi:hypothetical protein
MKPDKMNTKLIEERLKEAFKSPTDMLRYTSKAINDVSVLLQHSRRLEKYVDTLEARVTELESDIKAFTGGK